jgi:hypothetical protein
MSQTSQIVSCRLGFIKVSGWGGGTLMLLLRTIRIGNNHESLEPACGVHCTVQAFRAQEAPAQLHLVDNDIGIVENRGWGGAFNTVMQEWLKSGESEFCFIAAHDALPQEGCLALLLHAMMRDRELGSLHEF